MNEPPTPPDQAVRILRAKAAELEHIVLVHHRVADEADQDVSFDINLAADIALIARLLAEHIDQGGLRPTAVYPIGRPQWDEGDSDG